MFKFVVGLYVLCVGIAQFVQRKSMDLTAEVRFLEGVKDFSLLHSVHTGSRVHPAFNAMSTRDKAAGE
jgi:hypothetical protein